MKVYSTICYVPEVVQKSIEKNLASQSFRQFIDLKIEG